MVFIALRLAIPKGIETFPISRILSVPGAINSRRSICGKTMRDPNEKRKPPFPYKEKYFNVVHSWLDRTTHRFNENSKIIVVDGVVAAGKSAFAKELADDLDMLYMPEGNVDEFLINSYGFDLRKLDPKLPPSCRSFDTRDFCLNPYHFNAAALQLFLYNIKFGNYIDALAHVMNTGQGVVMDKSVYSDYVYIEAMAKAGFISQLAKSVYHDIKRHTIDELMRPHLAIYLDMPVSKVQEKIKERGLPHEQNSKALTPAFLTALEDTYKRHYLKEISVHAELLIYDWSDGGDVEVVVEDIERIDFDNYKYYDEKMKDWRLPKEQTYSDMRMKYTNEKHELMCMMNVPRFDCPELVVDGEDVQTFLDVYDTESTLAYAEGYHPKKDTGILWKMRNQNKHSYFY